MAARRDELNAYTFARKRTVGAFLQPGGGGNDEDAPRPVRAVVPSLVLAAVIMAGFGIWGMIKPSAPQGWDSGSNIILGKDSTTRYVILPGTNGAKVLHPVLNMASAKLVLPVDSKVVLVADSVLDNYGTHGPTIGIPYAPDKLPSAADAGTTKKWSVCVRPGADAAHPNQAVFVAAGADAATLARPDRVLSGAQSLYVQAIDQNGVEGTRYLIDPQGRKHEVGTAGMSDVDQRALRSGLFGSAQPERVTGQWLDTLPKGTAITFPEVPGLTQAKTPSSVQLSDPAERFVGRLVTFGDSDYVVGTDRLYQVSAFQAVLMSQRPMLQNTYDGKSPTIDPITPSDNANFSQQQAAGGPLAAVADWPQAKPLTAPANAGSAQSGRQVVCSTFDGMNGSTVQQSVWAGTDFPASFTVGSTSAHVSPGHGLFYRAMDASSEGSGSDYLITETGLRYSVPATSEGTDATASASPSPSPSAGAAQPQVNEAQARLGYKDTVPVLVPKQWSDLVPAGPALNTKTATQAQNS
ncbi:type VII secretion protein EccB [Kitasatospora sp. MAA4]|uniref:type VII secretion protein EccB n=1 Tax=Kitasatospora sp. MAA4 TaxID=3035093 RepID=UPI002476CC43|nr:type VII secretion protein EccB [Kitasatospora sp. MAA4]MDH6137260.1 type VII secretion protein EccB [Kitasatospora sp. MAA4]